MTELGNHVIKLMPNDHMKLFSIMSILSDKTMEYQIYYPQSTEYIYVVCVKYVIFASRFVFGVVKVRSVCPFL